MKFNPVHPSPRQLGRSLALNDSMTVGDTVYMSRRDARECTYGRVMPLLLLRLLLLLLVCHRVTEASTYESDYLHLELLEESGCC
jgi:hypothetical protein